MSFLTDEKKEILDKFVLFVKEQLELKTVPTVKIQNNRDGLKTTANYDYTKENKIINVNKFLYCFSVKPNFIVYKYQIKLLNTVLL